MGTTSNLGPITVQWAFVVAVFDGHIQLIHHEFVTDVHAKRIATLDDINAAAFLGSREDHFAWMRPSTDVYSCAFLVFQVPTGFIAASDNIFENVVPLLGPTNAQVVGAFGVLQNQITAERAANLAAQVAVSSTLSFLKNEAAKADPEADKKTPGGLIRV